MQVLDKAGAIWVLRGKGSGDGVNSGNPLLLDKHDIIIFSAATGRALAEHVQIFYMTSAGFRQIPTPFNPQLLWTPAIGRSCGINV